MKKAFWPDRNEECTTREYVAEYGGKYERCRSTSGHRPARCPACLQNLKVVGEDRPPQDRHFSHIGSSQIAPYCPLRNLADRKYEFLTDAPPDSARGKRIRESFFNYWGLHWSLLKSHLGGYADVYSFIEMIEVADQTKLWNRPSLSEWEIPYIFLVWRDYPPILDKSSRNTKYRRREWYRFWFDARVRTFEDLWIRTEGEFRIIRAEYAIPRSGRSPGLDQLKDIEIIRMNPNFLNEPGRPPHDWVVKEMIKTFPNELEG